MAAPITIDQRYDIVKNLGGGLSGEVMLVKTPEGDEVALKFLKMVQMNVTREEALNNFKNEFNILKELNHPNIARILDFGYDARIRKYYFTTEFIHGAEIHEACANQPFEVIEKLVVQVLRALNYLHARGIYHFDIKPQNILVRVENGVPVQAKIIDFGLAGLSSPGKKVGTPAYMAPEVIQGGVLDGRTDLYSTAVMIYKLFTGENPFADKKLKTTLENQVKLVPSPVTEKNPDIPEYWNHILTRMLEKKPVSRYSQASLVIRDLNFLSHKTFEIETKDTKLSYLPEKGSLIGREEEWERFTTIFNNIFSDETSEERNIIIVEGKKGTGKSRLISEIKHFAQLQNVHVQNYRQFTREESHERFVLTLDADQDQIDAGDVATIAQELAHKTSLIIWAVEKGPENWTNTTTITLNNYSKEHLKLYLESVTGLDSTPQKLLDEIFDRTQGNPLFVAEFIKSLIDSGQLFDSSGKWDANTFEDIKIDFSQINIPDSMEDHLLQRYRDLSQDQKAILECLALHGEELTSENLLTVTEINNTDSIIKDLVADDLLEATDNKNTYFFKNILFTDIIKKDLDQKSIQKTHDQFIAHLSDKLNSEQLLYHKGHGSDLNTAVTSLFELGQIYDDTNRPSLAVTCYKQILAVSNNPTDSTSINTRLKLGKALFGLKNFDAATPYFEDLITHCKNDNSSQDVELLLTALNWLVNTQIKLTHFKEAKQACETAKSYIAMSQSSLLHDIIFKNYEATILLKENKVEEAEEIFRITHERWKTELTEDEQRKVENNFLTECHLLRQENEKVEEICIENIKFLERSTNKYHLAVNYYALGDVYYRYIINDGKSEYINRTIEQFQKCEEIAREINDHSLMTRAFNGLGNLYHTCVKNREKALDYYQRALAVTRKTNQLFNAALISYNIGGIHIELHNHKDSFSFIIYAINTLQSLRGLYSPHAEINLFLCYIQLAEVHNAYGDYDKATNLLSVVQSTMCL